MILSAALLLLSTPILLQNPRDSYSPDPTPSTDSGDVAISSREEFTAAAFVDGATLNGDQVFVTTSDGRGIDWTTAVRIDSDITGSGKKLDESGVDVVANRAYVVWQDGRYGNQELYFNSFTGGAGWTGEIWLNKGLAAGTGAAFEYKMAVSRDPAGGPDHIYVLVRVTMPGAGLQRSLFLLASHDGGIAWGPPIHVPPAMVIGAYDVDAIDLIAKNGLDLFVLWSDDRGAYAGSSNDILYQRSFNGGATWLPASPVLNPAAPGSVDGEIDLSVSTGIVLAAWEDERTTAGTREARCNWSVGGGGFAASVQVGMYVPGTDPVYHIACQVNNGSLLVAYADGRTGTSDAFVSQAMAPGFPFMETPLTAGASVSEVLLTGVDDYMGVSILETGTGVAALLSSFSRDFGATWGPMIQINPNTNTIEQPAVNFNRLYQNYVCGWTEHGTATANTMLGGIRPQTLHATGTFQVGTAISFSVEAFPSTQTGWMFGVLLSGGSGNLLLPFGDNRNTGLVADGVHTYGLSLVPGALSGFIDPSGWGLGAGLTIPLGAPIGLDLSMMAVAIQPIGGGAVQFGAMTDVVVRTLLP